MKQLSYTILIFAVLCGFLIFRGQPGTEHDMRFVGEKDGCKLYSFKTFDGAKNKTHYYTNCRGEIIEPDEINITEVENGTEEK